MEPFTEQSNPRSQNIDVASPADIVTILNECNKEIFSGVGGYQNVFSKEILKNTSRIAQVVCEIIQSPQDGAIILSGCGTSGRLAFLTARSFNSKLEAEGRASCYHYIVAGGDKALFTSQEAPEDDPTLGMEELKKLSHGKRKILYVGITCGFSAPFVAGQIEYCLQHLDVFTPVLLGFNELNQARNTPIENWDRTFLEVAQKLSKCTENNEGFVLNPIVGSEPITGSSRMKCGSATKIILETIFIQAHHKALSGFSPSNMLTSYQLVCDWLSQYVNKVADIIQLAGNCLNADGHIYYIGADSLGILGMIDASECPPTFGASPDDIRGFLHKGYEVFGNKEGDISAYGRHFQLSIDDFITYIKPMLTCNDLVIFLGEAVPNFKNLVSSPAKKVVLQFEKKSGVLINANEHTPCDICIHFKLPWDQISETLHPLPLESCAMFMVEITAKWVLNAVSTGAHILKGKVFRNTMIDVKVSNNKLYHRAMTIIQKYSGCSMDEVKSCLLHSIYDKDDLLDSHDSRTISQHIEVATVKHKVVPIALMIAIEKCTVKQAKEALGQYKVVRSAILATINQQVVA